eukprot:TRINITY_DN13104_c0_g2_i1.p2 TRINITY_DN13104_c0_g2~~TRINITY_DN13104_c0_g2_i1.p2  ORF type:complete len:140 (-),score=13.24 TRINITY_DN13104_c0_g2_i1:429-848(-)
MLSMMADLGIRQALDQLQRIVSLYLRDDEHNVSYMEAIVAMTQLAKRGDKDAFSRLEGMVCNEGALRRFADVDSTQLVDQLDHMNDDDAWTFDALIGLVQAGSKRAAGTLKSILYKEGTLNQDALQALMRKRNRYASFS